MLSWHRIWLKIDKWWWLAGIPALVLRVGLAIAPERLWYDEAFSVLVARLPLERLLAATAGDVHPPLYYLLLNVWLQVARGVPLELGARLPSLLASLVALLFYWWLLPHLAVTGTQARIAWLLAAYMPGLIHYASEARMYALLQLEVLMALVALLRASRQWMRIVLGGLACGAAVLTHNTGPIYCIVIALIVLMIRRRSALTDLVGAGSVALLCWLPWLPTMLLQVNATAQQYWIWHNGISTASYMGFQSIFYYRLKDWLTMPAMMLAGGLTMAGVLAERRPWLGIWAIGPTIIGMLLSVVTSTGAILHRALTPTLFGLATLWARVLCDRSVRAILATLVIAVIAIADWTFVTRGRDMAGYDVLAVIEPQPGDIIYASNPAGLQLIPYIDLPIFFAPTTVTIGEMLSIQTQEAIGLQRAYLEDLSWRRVWLLEFRLPLRNKREADYIASLLEQYPHHKIVEYGDQLTTQNIVWLLQRE